MAEWKLAKSKTVPIKDPNIVPWKVASDVPVDPRVESGRRSVYDAEDRRKAQLRADSMVPDFSSGEDYQPPMSGSEIWSDVGQSVAPTGAGIVEGLAALPGELADARYTLAHYLNRKMSGGEENQNVRDFLKTMEQYDPVSMLPNTEDVQGATDPILEALGIKDEVRYEPQSPWGKGLYTAGQNVDPFPAAAKGARLVNKVFK